MEKLHHYDVAKLALARARRELAWLREAIRSAAKQQPAMRLPITPFHELWVYVDPNPKKRVAGCAHIPMPQNGGDYWIATAWLAGLMVAFIYPKQSA